MDTNYFRMLADAKYACQYGTYKMSQMGETLKTYFFSFLFMQHRPFKARFPSSRSGNDILVPLADRDPNLIKQNITGP